MIKSQLEMLLLMYFQKENWKIEIEDNEIVAIQSSGYGSGPSVVEISKLAQFMVVNNYALEE